MLIQGKDIFNLIPQRPPMVMVDKLYECTDQTATTGLKILPENIFVINNKLTESGLIENIAQSAALMTGWQSFNQDGDEQNIFMGVIGAVKDLQIYSLPEVNSELVTQIEILFRVANATIVNGKVRINNELVAECELKIFTSDQP